MNLEKNNQGQDKMLIVADKSFMMFFIGFVIGFLVSFFICWNTIIYIITLFEKANSII